MGVCDCLSVCGCVCVCATVMTRKLIDGTSEWVPVGQVCVSSMCEFSSTIILLDMRTFKQRRCSMLKCS